MACCWQYHLQVHLFTFSLLAHFCIEYLCRTISALHINTPAPCQRPGNCSPLSPPLCFCVVSPIHLMTFRACCADACPSGLPPLYLRSPFLFTSADCLCFAHIDPLLHRHCLKTDSSSFTLHLLHCPRLAPFNPFCTFSLVWDHSLSSKRTTFGLTC